MRKALFVTVPILMFAVVVYAAVTNPDQAATVVQVAKENWLGLWGQFKDFVVGFVQRNRHLAAPVVFGLALIESLALVSLIAPTVFIIVPVVGILSTANLDTAFVTEITIAGAVGASIGYQISYWVGRWFGHGIESHWPFYYFPKAIALGHAFFEKYPKSAATAVFLGHYVGPVRGIIPLLAGVLGMGQLLFLFVNITSSAIWAGGMFAVPILGFQGLEWLFH